MRILGIETSCDETSVALLEVKGGAASVSAHVTASQVITHAQYGGVVPEVAARMHIEALPPIFEKMALGAGDIDGIAVTRGPGLVTSLRVGVDFARGLAYAWKKPLVGVNHIEGHIAANWIGGPVDGKSPHAFPAIVLVVSGGHTEIILMKAFGRYERIGSTLDDAAGEAFDKVAKMLDLGYPGGPAVSKRALNGNPSAYALPRPLLSKPNFDFSFSGLKTAVLYLIESKTSWSEREIDDLCASFQEAAIEVLVAKTARAAAKHKAKTVFLAGGVAANRLLRERLGPGVAGKAPSAKTVLPNLEYCTDNSAMIALAGYFKLSKRKKDAVLEMQPDPNWELGV